jgi:RimJ/RimL family protein N-acetyltransferase
MEVKLREMRESDLIFLNQCRNKYEVSKNLNLFKPAGMDEELAWFNRKKDEVHFVIELDAKGKKAPTGQVSLINLSHPNRSCELTIFLDDAYFGKGLGRIAITLMLDYAFGQLNMNKVMTHVYEFNDKSKKVFEATGFTLEGTLRDFIFKDGKYVNAFIFGILAREYKEDKNIVEPLLYKRD